MPMFAKRIHVRMTNIPMQEGTAAGIPGFERETR